MDQPRFTEKLKAFGTWKETLIQSISHYQEWLEENKMGSSEDELRIIELIESLKADKLTVAFVAEFARGKTELINAIFFSEYDRRLLPSEAGRTTMCPTELFFDQNANSSYIRLLPIETRLSETSIAELRKEEQQWTRIPLNLDHADEMADAFQEIVKTKRVPVEMAKRLGLYSDDEAELHRKNSADLSEIEVPLWRHALISFPHPLLKQGLVILDTPGLNSVGSEPELTLSMLPNAQAVLFVMAADTGVTKSDLDMWNLNVKPIRKDNPNGLIVVLNKIDTLWDDLKTPESIQKTIEKQCSEVARTLSIDEQSVLPASAQKALLAKIRHDKELLTRSNILALEAILANTIVPAQQELVRHHVQAMIGAMVKESHGLLVERLNETKRQLNELVGLSGKNTQVIEHLMQKTREEQVAYHKNLEAFNTNKKLLSDQNKELLKRLSLTKLDELVSLSRGNMTETWTTIGLKRSMHTFFEGVNGMFDEVTEYSEQLNRLVTTLYHKFHTEHDIPEMTPILFVPQKYMEELKKLNEEAEAFIDSPVTVMTEQSFVIKKFFISLVSHARNIFFKAHRDAESWHKEALAPLVKHIKERKEQMEQRLENLRKVSQSHETLQEQMERLKGQGMEQKKRYEEIHAIYKAIYQIGA